MIDTRAQIKAKEGSTLKRTRRPFATKSPNLPLPEITGYVGRWFNDEENRLVRAQDADWEFVTHLDFPEFRSSHTVAPNDDLGSRISVVVGTNEQGASIRAYCMKIRKEFWDEDQRAKQDAIDETDKAIHGGRVQPYAGSYVKQISIS